MSDYERYADYDNIEEPPRRGPVGLIFKILGALICGGMIGLLAFRMILFRTYPASVSQIVFTDALTDYYQETNGRIGAQTQKLRSPYDDPNTGYFFCDHMILVRGIGELQVALRYNVSTLRALGEKYELATPLDPSSDALFSYRLVDNRGEVFDDLVYHAFDTRVMYRYHKLVFDGVDFSDAVKWISLEIFFAGTDTETGEPIARIPVFENHEEYSALSPYRLSRREVP